MKHKIMATIVVGMVGLFTIGCSNAPDIPEWYLSKKIGHIIGTGSAKPNKSNDLNFQKNEAMLNAREDLAKNIKAAVIAKDTKEAGKNADGEIKKDITFRTESITKVGISSAEVIHSKFMDDGTLFIQLGVKTDILTGKVK